MSARHDKPTDRAGPAGAPGEPSSDRRRSAGRVVFDSRGKAIWEWNAADGDSTSILLKQLENDQLALEPSRRAPALDERASDERRSRKAGRRDRPLELEGRKGGGFDPYNRS